MQFPGQGKQPPGILYITNMSRPDAALALALMFGYEGKREARVGAIAVTGAGLATAAYCDAVVHFYASRGRMPDTNRFLPVGLEADTLTLPPDAAMVKAAVERHNEKGEPVYARGVHRVTDTSEVAAMLRNAVTGLTNGNSTVILSGPAGKLVRSMDLPGVRELFATKVKALIVVDAAPVRDVEAMRRILSDWPSPIILCPREIGEAALFPAASVEKEFAWTPDHPVADAYRAFKAMPYDAPTWDMAAVMYAAHPDLGFLELSEPGTIQLSDDGEFAFSAGAGGKHRSLRQVAAQKDKLVETYVEIASAQPAVRQPFSRPQKKDDAVKPDPAKPVTK